MTPSFCLALVIFSFSPRLIRVPGVVVENIEMRSKSSSLNAVLVYIYSGFLCMSLSVPAQRNHHQAKNKTMFDYGNSLRPRRDSNPDPCTYVTLDHADRSLYH